MPIPLDMGECIEHFKQKGKPYKQCLAICLSNRRKVLQGAKKEVVRKNLEKG